MPVGAVVVVVAVSVAAADDNVISRLVGEVVDVVGMVADR